MCRILILANLRVMHFHAVVVFGLGKNFLFKSILGGCDVPLASQLLTRVFRFQKPQVNATKQVSNLHTSTIHRQVNARNLLELKQNMIVPLSTQIMVNSHYGKRLKLFQFYLIITSVIFIEYHECRRDYTNCCEILKIISSSFLAKFHPEHLGSYKLMKNSKNVYISLTEPNSYIYLLSLGKGNSDVFKFRYCNFEL